MQATDLIRKSHRGAGSLGGFTAIWAVTEERARCCQNAGWPTAERRPADRGPAELPFEQHRKAGVDR